MCDEHLSGGVEIHVSLTRCLVIADKNVWLSGHDSATML